MKHFLMLAVFAGLAPAAPLEARQAVLRKPFRQPAAQAQRAQLCGTVPGDIKARSEECVGTLDFCNRRLFDGTAETFPSPEACRASRDPAPGVAPGNPAIPGGGIPVPIPAPIVPTVPIGGVPVPIGGVPVPNQGRRPFRKPALGLRRRFKLCGRKGDRKRISEACVGTRVYCDRRFYEITREFFASPSDCRLSRQVLPSSAGRLLADGLPDDTEDTAPPEKELSVEEMKEFEETPKEDAGDDEVKEIKAALEKTPELAEGILEPPKENEEPPKEAQEPPKENPEPPKENPEPPKETQETPKETPEPPKENSGPQKE
ncbi:hypothetical protein HRG_009432 [Hirsutella rhossiliensis]|uniref:IgA FC receptor n=1 Tax=Hirsutella rhossiliensis TaxID=111463 RepID=A0A9P8MQX2_9HYPO|nr:uncharacterized protein HRG_09432 [Hirsutella rhossiliensis]KAH0959650.1 hypothetical protein HRG_09432 [Hirsutella rhossiliensis]